MQAIVIKYIQIFCVAVLFDNVSCDQLLLRNYEDDLLFYQTTSCTASCLKHYANKTLKECYERECVSRKFNETGPEERNATNFKVKLLCRDDSTLVVHIVDDQDTGSEDMYYDNCDTTYKSSCKNITRFSTNYEQSGERQGNGNLYMVKVENGNVLSEKIVYITNSSLVQIKNLASNTSYYITGTVMHSNYQFTNAVKSDPIKTLTEGYKPGNITSTHLSNFTLSAESNDSFDVVVSWEAADDRTCHYSIYSYALSDQSNKITPETINKTEYTMRNLSFGTDYRFAIQAVNKKIESFSGTTLINITTPTCWDWYKNDTNLEICPPYPPQNIVVSEDFISQNLYNLNISWDKPERQPLYYILIIKDYINSTTIVNISGVTTQVLVDNVRIGESDYEVKLTAFSLGGSSSNFTTLSVHNAMTKVHEKYQTLAILLYVGGSVIALSSVVILIITFVHLRARSRRRKYRNHYFNELDKQLPIEIRNEDKRQLLEEEIKKSFLSDGMEIDEDDIDIRDIIGEGAFGFVNRAILLPTGKNVAVKRLKDVVSFDIMRNFCQEVEVMRSVDKHPNIVGIVGHCMKDIERMMLLTEYCDKGNLLDFLRNYWQHLMKCSSPETPVTNDLIDDKECSFQKPRESEFNFGSSILEKNLIKQKNIHNIENDSVPDLSIKNLIINKLYDECSDNLDSKRLYTLECDNSCKSYVDIIDEGYNNKIRISVKDCDCRENKKNNLLNYLDQSISIAENPGYDKECNINENNRYECTLTKKDLLSFALQIATGMEFLSFNKVVHRDLAARNVCICSDYTVKIADFGLSRDIYQDNVYKKSSEGKLPIKWLALESMTFQMYTSQSDVWSYGILLYEIVTLGSTPYPAIQTSNLLKLLEKGYRMEKPSNCDDNIYELMLSCWRTMPSERPTFTEIKVKLQRFISELTDNQPINNKMFEDVRSIASSESYLKPI